jgi:hypothetical protein
MRNRTHRKSERGAVLAVVGICMVLMVGMAAIGVDLGRLALTANEAQILADAGAASGADALLKRRFDSPGLDPEVVARNTIFENPIDGSGATGSNIVSFEYGTWTENPPGFEPGGGPDDANAVRVTTEAIVNNVFAPVLSSDFVTSRVERVAIGSADSCPSEGRPVLPVTFGDCMFDGFEPPDDCSAPPTATFAPDQVDTACYTSLDDSSSASASRVRGMLEPECCAQCNGEISPFVRKGDMINVQNGVVGAVLQAIEGCYNAGIREFTVPIVKCDADGTLKCTQQKEVVGFARLEISQVVATGNPKGIHLAFFCNDDGEDQGGGGGLCTVSFGSTIVR